MQSESDTAVIEQGGSRPGFDQLFAGYYPALARLVYRVVGDTAWAEAVAAEAFWRLHRNPPRRHDNLQGWLYRTGLRLALDEVKMRKRRAHYEAQAPSPPPLPDPEQQLAQRERQSRVRAVLAAMKPDRAALLVLRSEGYSLNQIAAILGLNPNSVGTLLARADAAFRKDYIGRYGQC